MTETKWHDRTNEVLDQIGDAVKHDSKFLVMSTRDYMWVRRWAYSSRAHKELFEPTYVAKDLIAGFFCTLTVNGQKVKVYLTHKMKGKPPVAFATKAEVDAVM